MQRASGILLHPTALPNQLPLGDLGDQAFAFIDFLAKAGQSVWQVLPLGPTGYGHSPYNALSAFAGNPALIDLRQLVAHGDLDSTQLTKALAKGSNSSFHQAHDLKQALLQKAARNFLGQPETERQQQFQLFCRQHADWLDDYSLFMAIRLDHNRESWVNWPKELRDRDPLELESWHDRLRDSCDLQKYQQFVFTEQWRELKRYANSRGIGIFGDIPIFVAYDSADVWANQKLFQLDAQGRATAISGVPPDYFSKTGQRWGNPLYQWQEHINDDFSWWLKRFNWQFQSCDMVRIDHFRGFLACWSIPAEETTAINGHWETAPGRQLFERLRAQRADLPIIAEDLGVITPDVEELRNDFGFPGMKILQFAFDSGPDNPYLPEHHVPNSVVYTGTHDNDTTLGWWRSLSKPHKDQVRAYLGTRHLEMPWDLIRQAMASSANLCIIPVQDLLGLGKEGRFNTPGRATGNWEWQMSVTGLTTELAQRLRELTEKHQRTAVGIT